MKIKIMNKAFLSLFVIAIFYAKGIAQNPYPNNRAPLVEKPYVELPLGAIQARDWLKEQFVRQKNGMTGNLDERIPWLWESGMDGLVEMETNGKEDLIG